MIDRSIPMPVTTGSLYPLSTLKSIRQLNEIGVHDIELTLQANEFFLTFERKLSMPILPELLALVQGGKLCVRSVHAPSICSAHLTSLWARKQYLIHSIEICNLLGSNVLVIHPMHVLLDQESALDYLSGDETPLPSLLLPGIDEIVEKAQSVNVILALENIQEWLDESFFNAPKNMSCFLRDLNHSTFGCTLDLMHAQVPGVLEDFINALSADIVNIHASDLLPPTKRVAISKGVIDWERVMPKLQGLPNLRQLTVELSNPQTEEISESVKFLASFMS